MEQGFAICPHSSIWVILKNKVIANKNRRSEVGKTIGSHLWNAILGIVGLLLSLWMWMWMSGQRISSRHTSYRWNIIFLFVLWIIGYSLE
ncbi:hypothetical protein ACLIBH_10620 [Virgibacillus sp. W0430]|uniref:hypothetical protein n=1 Tax=Virgibacillus sp. W0430 TaxID=3391580 RepID=UPI003F48F15A